MSKALTALASALLAGSAGAQSFNVDLGSPTSVAGVPAPTYGAAAGQPGVWNALGATTSFGGGIVDLAGMPTGVTVSPLSPNPANFYFNNAQTTGNDQALLDDLCNLNGQTFVFSGLANGFYRVYTYAFAPDLPSAVTAVTPAGSSTRNVGGADWAGMHVEGETYALHCLQVTGGTVMITASVVTSFASINGFQFVKQTAPCPGLLVDTCSGNGGNQTGCTDCPCLNNAVAGATGGCLNSLGQAARLVGSGTASVAADTLRFTMTGGTALSFTVLTSGDNVAPTNAATPCFGLDSGIQAMTLDGLRCAVGNVQRHGTRPTDANGDVGVMTNGWGPPSGPTGGLLAQAGFAAGQTRHFQVVYRENPMLGCLRGQNSTQAVSVTVLP